MVPLAERLRERVALNPSTGCLEFTGHRVNGYGVMRIGARRRAGAHRVAWEVEHGPPPPGMVVCHRCDNRICCNVEHLFLGTCADNTADMSRKGRGVSGPLPYGVNRLRSGRWAARGYRPATVYLGTFDTIEEAAEVARLYKLASLTSRPACMKRDVCDDCGAGA